MTTLTTQADLFHSQLNDALDKVTQEAQALAPTLAPEPLQISTMTIFTVLNYKVDLPELERLWNTPELQHKRTISLPEARLKTTTGASFYNCLVFSIGNATKRKPVVKVFCNGNLHITGVQTMHDALTLSQSFCTLFNTLIDLTPDQDGYKIEDIDIQLINSYFKNESDRTRSVSLRSHCRARELTSSPVRRTLSTVRVVMPNGASLVVTICSSPITLSLSRWI